MRMILRPWKMVKAQGSRRGRILRPSSLVIMCVRAAQGLVDPKGAPAASFHIPFGTKYTFLSVLIPAPSPFYN